MGHVVLDQGDPSKVEVVASWQVPTTRTFEYASKELRPTELANYNSMKLESLALKWAVSENFR